MTDAEQPPLVPRDELRGPAHEIAPRLLGALVVGRGVVARLVEVEAYGPDDPASHAVRGPTPANRTMFGPAGHLYVYVSYGVHQLGNVVVGPAGTGAAVLLRAAEVVDGDDTARTRRGADGAEGPVSARWLAGGPGRLGQVLALHAGRDDGLDLLDPTAPLTLRRDEHDPVEVATGPRVGVTGAPDVPWRFWVDGHPAVSRYQRSPRARSRRDE